MKEKTITIICNGEKEIILEKDRKKAIREYQSYANCCDGHEALRYEYIADCLREGEDYIDDDVI